MHQDNEAAFAEVRVPEDLAKYLEAIAKEVNSDVSTVISSLVFDGLAYNMLRNLVEDHGSTLDEVVVDFLNRASASDGVPVLTDDGDESEEDEENDETEYTLEIEGKNGENEEVDVELEE